MKRLDLIPKIQELGINVKNIHLHLVNVVLNAEGLESSEVNIKDLEDTLKKTVRLTHIIHQRSTSMLVRVLES